MKECVTHHHACDCREAKFAKLEADLAAAQRELAAWKQAVYSFERGEYPGADSGIADHVAELLAQEGGT